MLNDSDSKTDVILFFVDLAKVQKRVDVVIMLNRGQQLLLRFLQEVQMVVALPQGQLPPRILVIVELRCITSQLQAFLEVMLYVEEVLEDKAGFRPALCDLAQVCLGDIEEVLAVLGEGCGREAEDAAV